MWGFWRGVGLGWIGLDLDMNWGWGRDRDWGLVFEMVLIVNGLVGGWQQNDQPVRASTCFFGAWDRDDIALRRIHQGV